MSERVYVDLEYLFPGMNREIGRPTEKDLRQIVQIAAIIFDTESSQEISSFDILVLPTYDRILPPFFVELTGITQEMVDTRGVEFSQALQKFIEFCGSRDIWTFDKDFEVLVQNCGYKNTAFALSGSPFVRVKPKLPAWGIDASAYSSGTLYRAAGLIMNGHVHNALHDVRSMAVAVGFFEARKF